MCGLPIVLLAAVTAFAAYYPRLTLGVLALTFAPETKDQPPCSLFRRCRAGP